VDAALGETEIRELHERFAPTPAILDRVHGHSVVVHEIAGQLADRTAEPVDRELLRAGALLHDVGVYLLYDRDGTRGPRHYLRHGVLGHELLAGLGFDEELCRFCSCHIGVGLTRQEVLDQRLPIPAADYLARTTEEALVMYADAFHSKSRPSRLVTAEEYRRSLHRFGAVQQERFARLRERFGDPDTVELGGLGVG
jgi:uncharacterized protein